ncbi:MAG: rhodanese family protein [Pseudomonadota bacterium]
MTRLTKLTPAEVSAKIAASEIVLVDVREPDERAREHIPGSVSLPVSSLDTANLSLEAGKGAVFHCKTGMRTEANCAALATHTTGEAFVLEGGLDGWKAAGFPTEADKSQPIEINRQVQITAGSLVFTGVLLSLAVHPAFVWVSAFVGAGLVFAGVSGTCAMGRMLATMPWNRRAAAPAPAAA